MRRKESEVTDSSKIEEFIAREQILRIAFYDEGEIYILPINYGYCREDEQYSFYFHGAKAGRKYELAKGNPSVGFEIDGNYQVLEGEIACEFSSRYQSVIGTGTLCLTEDKEEKIKGLNAIMRQVTKQAEWSYNDKMLDAVTVFRLDVKTMSCKAR